MSEYGKGVRKAFAAVCQVHADLSRLFSELRDREYRGWVPVFGSDVFKTGTRDFKKRVWMPAGVMQLFFRRDDPRLVEGLTCRFFAEEVQIEEPILIASQIRYRKKATDPKAVKETDAWNILAGDGELQVTDEVRCVSPMDDDRYEWAKVKGKYVYDIQSREAVSDLIEGVRQAAVAIREPEASV
jgi:hypothetical protein